MNYRNGKDILPPELLKELQKYIDGELVYIPKKEEKRAGWGESNGTRIAMQWRNLEIYRCYENGMNISQLMDKYHLSEDSIRKIITKARKVVLPVMDLKSSEDMQIARV